MKMMVTGDQKTCDLSLAGVMSHDQGHYMCMLTQASTYHTKQSWTHLEVAEANIIRLESPNIHNNISDNNNSSSFSVSEEVLEVLEGVTLELECIGSGAFPAPEYVWSIGDQLVSFDSDSAIKDYKNENVKDYQKQIIDAWRSKLSVMQENESMISVSDTLSFNDPDSKTVSTMSRLNLTTSSLHNGSIVTCHSIQYNSYTGEKLYHSTSSIMVIVHEPQILYLGITQSRQVSKNECMLNK